MQVPLQLSVTRPDFESLVLQLQYFLNSRATWTDLLPSSTGQTLIEMMAAIGTFNQFAVENAARESFLTTAVRDSSIYAITRMLGVRIGRKSPASTSAIITRPASAFPQIIQAHSQFTVNGVMCFNRKEIVFSAGEIHPNPLAKDVYGNLLVDTLGNHYTDPAQYTPLYEGEVRTQTFAATSNSFNEIALNEPKFVVSDTDVIVTVISQGTGAREIWSTIDQGIWTAGPSDKVYYDSTLGTGDTVLSFGDGYHGALAGLGNTIEVRHVITKGSTGNNGGQGLAVAIAEYPTISGITTTGISGGSDEQPSSYYKILAPAIYRARSRAVTPLDYKAIVAGRQGVAGVTIQAQKDIPEGKTDIRWMNVVRVCILPSNQDVFTDLQWSDFISWFAGFHHAAVQIQKYDPVKILVDIELVIALTPSAAAETVVASAEARIRSLFTKDVTTLGRRLAVSDIIDACALPTVDYTIVSKLALAGEVGATDLLTPDKLSYFALNNLVIGAQYSERTLFNEAARRVI